jgi:hypothetical protein
MTRGLAALAALPALAATPGCVSCPNAGAPDSGAGASDAANLPGDSGAPGCTSFDACGAGFVCQMGACVACPPEGCPAFTSIPLPATGVVFWTFASAGALGAAMSSPTHTLVGVLGQGTPLPQGADFAQDSATHVNYAGFAAALVP